MKTSCNVSTICYSPEKYVKDKLDDLIKSGKIDFYCFIKHQPEEEEKKEHLHLLVCPSGTIDTKDLDVMLSIMNKKEKLGTCKIWKKTGKNISDFLLYSLHEPLYLKIKRCEEKKYSYKDSDFVTSDKDTLDVLIFEAFHETEFSFNNRIMQLLFNTPNLDKTSRDIVFNGYIPLGQMCSYHHLLQILKGG